MIFDSCYSGSGTREPKYLVRGITRTVTIHADLDRDIWGASSGCRMPSVPSEFLQEGMRSHVLLAACSAKEVAREYKSSKRGVFTTALLQKLEATSINQVTYTALIRQIGSLSG